MADSRPGLAGGPTPYTFVEAMGPVRRSLNLRRLPAIVQQALAMVWSAARWDVVAVLMLQLASAAATVVQLLVARALLARLTSGTPSIEMGELFPHLLAVAGATALVGVANALASHMQRWMTERVSWYTVLRIGQVSTSVDLATFETASFHDQLQRARTSGMTRPTQMVSSLIGITSGLVGVVGLATAVAVIEPLVLAFVLAAAGPALVVSVINSRRTHRFEWDMTKESRERLHLGGLVHGVQAAKEIRTFRLGKYFIDRIERLTGERFALLGPHLRRQTGLTIVGRLVAAVAMATALAFLIYLVSVERISVADAAIVAVALQSLAGRLQSITSSLGMLFESTLFIEDFARFLDSEAEVLPRGDLAPDKLVRAELVGVSFRYPDADRLALRDIDFHISAGEVVALVGSNGSGKTTLAKLLCGLYEPSEGDISWNGRPYADHDPARLAARTSVLFQDYMRYHLPLYENVALGEIERFDDADAVAAALAAAGALPADGRLGLQSRLGREFDGGTDLSVGQWQRLALARAYFRNADLIVLDEPTASLDARSEYDLFERIRNLSEGRAVALISHRFSSVRNADRIYVLDCGEIVERGTHDELIGSGGIYAELFSLQASAYLARDVTAPER